MKNLQSNTAYTPRKKKVVVNKDGKKEEVRPTLMHNKPTKQYVQHLRKYNSQS